MWYQISSNDAYLLIEAARCRVSVIEDCLRRGAGDSRGRLLRDMSRLLILIDVLHDGGDIYGPGLAGAVGDLNEKYPGIRFHKGGDLS